MYVPNFRGGVLFPCLVFARAQDLHLAADLSAHDLSCATPDMKKTVLTPLAAGLYEPYLSFSGPLACAAAEAKE